MINIKWGHFQGDVPFGVSVGKRVPELDGTIMYRIVDASGGSVKSLFHGTSKSREFPIGQWIKADIKPVKNPGTSKGVFLSGFHVVKDLGAAKNYLTKFKSKVSESYRLVAVRVGEIRTKPNATSEVYLTDRIKVLEVL